jgi:hypothetical protein
MNNILRNLGVKPLSAVEWQKFSYMVEAGVFDTVPKEEAEKIEEKIKAKQNQNKVDRPSFVGGM